MIKIKDFFGLCLVTGVMIIAYLTLSANQSKYLDGVEAALESGEAMVLDASTDSVALAEFFVRKGYYSGRDAEFIAGSIARPLNKGIVPQNLGELNKRSFRVEAEDAYSRGGEIMRSLVERSRGDLGWSDKIESIYNSESIPDSLNAVSGDTKLKVQVKAEDDSPVEGVLVRLTEHYVVEDSARDSLLAVCFTDKSGRAEFAVSQGRFYSVLPIRRGFEYGASKGTRGGARVSSSPYVFRQKVHTLAPLSSDTFSSIKADTTLMVRTPQQYRDSRFLIFLVFLGVWWLLIITLSVLDRNRKAKSDSLSLILLMTLSGVCLLAMFSIPNPLNDMPRAREMIEAIVVGVIAIGVLSRLDFISFYNGRLRIFGLNIKFDFVGQILKPLLPKKVKWPDGLGYLIIAAVFIALLTLFGQGPEGSDAKVNLSIGGFAFQPSELNKFLVVLFMAAFFARNAAKIQSFSEKLDKMRFRFQLRTVAFIFVAIAAILSLYLVLLSDMGPALVLMVTFILIYSVARRDFPQLLLGVATFALMLVLPSWLGMSDKVRIVLVILWFVLWVAGGWAAKKRLYESAIFMNLVLTLFILGPTILSSLGFSEADRLANRMAVVGEGVWDNDAVGGDQVVNGLWALSTGGMTGQGLAKGSPGLIPAGHTDMILASIGEQMGWVMLLLVAFSIAILLHRSLLLARRSAHPFAFYLATGIAVITGVQFLVIAFGSIGVIPLTGVAVPFLSHGKTSLILNLAAFGVIASLSRYEPLAIQKKDISKYDGMVATMSLSFILAAGVLLGYLFKYQVSRRDEILVRPAFVAGSRGERMAEYNPRIGVLMRRLDSGNIYDRNGLLLATSHHSLTDEERTALINAGLSEEALTAEFAREQRRYYPFGNHTLFMVGDANSSWLVYSKYSTYPRGFAVESQKSDFLKGFNLTKKDRNGHEIIRKVESDVRINPYLPSQTVQTAIAEKDYARPEFLRMLKEGPDSKAVDEWNKDYHKRNVFLTMDARLQMILQQRMDKYLTETVRKNASMGRSHPDKIRASVVVLDPATGEFLASANYPLPDGKMLRESKEYRSDYHENNASEVARTDRDMGMTLASAPGSTGKIMTSLASLMQDPANKDYVHLVLADERVHDSNGSEHAGRIGLTEAISSSSNCYFIHLLNDKDLYSELDSVFRVVGVEPQVDGRRPHQPYFFYRDEFLSRQKFSEIIAQGRKYGLARYKKHTDKLARGVNGHKELKMNLISRWAWGQEMGATPLTMARVASIVANDGVFVPTRYFLDTLGKKAMPVSEGEPIRIVSTESARAIQRGMSEEAAGKFAGYGLNIGGKTGTPDLKDSEGKTRHDGWYICYMDAAGGGRLALALRLEWGRMSSEAKTMVDQCILPALKEAGYVR